MGRSLGVNAVIVRDGKVLLIYRTDIPVWELPGGAVDDNESLLDAVKREVAEETGLAIEVKRLTGVYSKPKWIEGGVHILTFLCESPDGEFLSKTSETADAGFFDPHDFPRDLWPVDRVCIADALEGNAAARVRTLDTAWPFGDEVGWLEAVQMMRERPEMLETLFNSAKDSCPR
ncbi:NUDIX hydrolase [Candidatus Sumerlaeota bacterium]|nr:NUDIX hydrolase [Candidatus Sumerlaeota bacterium]